MKLLNPISLIATPNCKANSSQPMPLVLNVAKISMMTMLAYRRLPREANGLPSEFKDSPKDIVIYI